MGQAFYRLLNSLDVDTDTFDSYRLYSVCALHFRGIEPSGQVLLTRGEGMSPVAIVTASDSGIGQESAKALAENGFDLGITYRTDEAGAQETLEAVEAAGRRGEVRRLDLTELPEAADVIDDLADALGGMDVLVNNAGTGDPTGEFLELSYEEWRQVIDTNLSGAFLCAQRAARRMVDAGNGGRIINITSVHEHIPRTGASAYCASKGGLGLLTKVMAMELAEYGILVNAVGPGEISTPMTGAEDEDPTTIERPKLPLGRPGHAREIAAWVAFLASEKSSYATGASFVVDGGLTLMAAELSS
jgi:NAD(P)-dependent dehydrogenase (short-subunit alcohol dehydrogenase family)